MFRIDGAKLSLTRGDDAYLLVGASLAAGESLVLRVYRDAGLTDLLFSRGRLPDGSFLIQKHDTAPLPFGVLWYEVVKIDENEDEAVVLGPDTLTVLEEVH
jgi:hypothetical protein